MRILAIETSCDETAAAVVEDGTKILSSVVASSTAMHKKYGGIVPEIASREQLQSIIPVLTDALSGSGLEKRKGQTPLDTVDAIAVTIGPGLIGSLLVGVETAKTIAFVTGKPIIPVNHVLAHMYANFVQSDSFVVHRNSSKHDERITHNAEPINFPAISLVVSGGHTELYLMNSTKDLTWLGGTLDDAAGECFDKTARLLGFGSGGGPAIAATAAKCQMLNDKCQIKLPRPLLHDETLNFSFSGLKTAVMREWKKQNNPNLAPAFAYEIQEAITDVLVTKTIKAAKMYGAKSILLSGGVAANSRLREKFKVLSLQFKVVAPSAPLCTDNAVMIAAAAYFLGSSVDWHKITAISDLSVELKKSISDEHLFSWGI